MSWQDQSRNDLGQFQGGGGGGGTGGGGAAGIASGVHAIAKAFEAAAQPFISATVQNGKYRAARLAGENALAIERKWNYFFQQQTVERRTALSADVIRHRLDFEAPPSAAVWRWRSERALGNHQGPARVLRNRSGVADRRRRAGEAQDWTRLLQMAATAAPLGAAIIDVRHREPERWIAGGGQEAELDFAFRRAASAGRKTGRADATVVLMVDWQRATITMDGGYQ